MSALNIKDAKVAEKARKLARLRGETITEAVSQALDLGLQEMTRRGSGRNDARERRVDDIVRRFRSGLRRGARQPQEILDEMYDESGLPR